MNRKDVLNKARVN